GYLLFADVSLPMPGHYRPAIPQRARDGFCSLGPALVPASQIDPKPVSIPVSIEGREVDGGGTAGLIRPADELLAAVSEFMTLSPGDVLGLGAPAPAPRARAGQT